MSDQESEESLESEKNVDTPSPPISSALVSPLPSTTGSSKLLLAPIIKNEPVGSSTGNPRNKVALRPGFSLMDWIRLTQSGKDLAGTGGKTLQVTTKELAKHKLKRDAWMAINGIVYNVTSYMDYHPGGLDELMKGAGKDATKIFNEIHRWVNYESMLKACLVGKLITTPGYPSLPSSGSHKSSTLGSDQPIFSFKPAQKVIPPITGKVPTFNWFQTDTSITVTIYTRRKDISTENVIINVPEDDMLQVLVLIHENSKEEMVFQMAYKLSGKVSNAKSPKVSVGTTSGKVEIVLQKLPDSEPRWPFLGTELTGNNIFCPISEFQSESFDEYRLWTLVSAESVTHDVVHFVLEPPKHKVLYFNVPCGHHIHLKATIMGMDVVRSYTPTLSNMALDLYLKKSPEAEIDQNLQLLVKIYPDGVMSPHLKTLTVGSKILVSNHTGSFTPSKLIPVTQLVLVAAGTGFTPMAKLIQYFYSVHQKTQKTSSVPRRKVNLLFFNKTERDIIWRDQLEKIQKETENRDDFTFKVHHILSKDPKWSGFQGHINSKLLKDVFQEPFEESSKLVCICGPKQFTEAAQRLFRDDLKFADSEMVLFQG